MYQSIEITTTQNVTIDYELASLRERILGFLLDALAVSIGYLILSQILHFLFKDFWDMGWGLFVSLLALLVYFMYHILMEILNNGQSLGKMALSISVVRLDGKDPEWSDIVMRSILQLIDSLLCLGVIGILLIKTTPKHQRLGDMAANTTVIKIQQDGWRFRLEDILSISTLQNYTPMYPEVRKLHESDMIFVKNMLSRYQKYPNQAHQEVVEDLVTKFMGLLNITERPLNRLEFLRTLLKDYIVLTR